MADLQTEIQTMYREMRDLLPIILTETVPVSANIFNSFVQSLATNEGQLVFDMKNAKENLNVLTCVTGGGIEAWEAIAGLEPRTDLSIQNRRARVFSRVSAKPTTIKILRDIIESYLGDTPYSIFEYWTLGDPASAFNYRVEIPRPPTVDYDELSLQQDIIRVQPAHCSDRFELLNTWDSIADTFSFTESVSAVNITYITIGTSTIDGPDRIGP
jgi:hypothetical protein